VHDCRVFVLTWLLIIHVKSTKLIVRSNCWRLGEIYEQSALKSPTIKIGWLVFKLGLLSGVASTTFCSQASSYDVVVWSNYCGCLVIKSSTTWRILSNSLYAPSGRKCTSIIENNLTPDWPGCLTLNVPIKGGRSNKSSGSS